MSNASKAEAIADGLAKMGGPTNMEAAGKIYATLAVAEAIRPTPASPIDNDGRCR